MNKRIIPQFSATQINSVEDYERFFNIRSYIRALSSKIKDNLKLTSELKSLMERSGHSNFTKFKKLRVQYDNLQRSIPHKYLDAIGVELKEIKRLLVIDQENYDKALKFCLKPAYGIIRIMAAVYNNIKIPKGMIEKDAIKYLRAKADTVSKRLRCCINYPTLKTIWIEKDSELSYSYYRPEIQFSKKSITPTSDGTGIGTTSL